MFICFFDLMNQIQATLRLGVLLYIEYYFGFCSNTSLMLVKKTANFDRKTENEILKQESI